MPKPLKHRAEAINEVIRFDELHPEQDGPIPLKDIAALVDRIMALGRDLYKIEKRIHD